MGENRLGENSTGEVYIVKIAYTDLWQDGQRGRERPKSDQESLQQKPPVWPMPQQWPPSGRQKYLLDKSLGVCYISPMQKKAKSTQVVFDVLELQHRVLNLMGQELQTTIKCLDALSGCIRALQAQIDILSKEVKEHAQERTDTPALH